uniref:Uncharacterized protein n=1 Tax=Anguilla anguilla TaxID=7936 RepID=A0A0E9S6U8_ANGAN
MPSTQALKIFHYFYVFVPFCFCISVGVLPIIPC